jgi:putative N6-adenine-specific DNA methylase
LKKTGKTFTIIVKTIPGLEEVLATELAAIGAKKTQILRRAVSFEGDEAMLYKANYRCRTALRVLKPLAGFKVQKQEDLYNYVLEIPWEDLLDSHHTLAVDAVIHDSVFTNSQYVAMKTKDAVVDRLRKLRGIRPSVNLDEPDLKINIHINGQQCDVSLDSSGQSLHRRGYRQGTGIAPMNEVLAAGLVLLTGWDRTIPFVDPMCGSGTLLIEAAMAAQNIPAGYYRKDFGFMKWIAFDPETWNKIKETEDAKITRIPLMIKGSDISEKMIRIAGENVRFAKLQDSINLEVAPLERSSPFKEKGVVLTNPPYDERMQMDDIISFYKQIGDVLKKRYQGYHAWVISSDLRALKFIGLHPSKKITVFNGPLECRLVRFSLY